MLRYQFGSFDVDSVAGRLLKRGAPVLLREQPFQVLLTLLSTPGEVVSRETLRTRLWGDSTFVDFENGLNSAISRLRDALDDVAKTPLWIETIPKRGYRFIGPLPRSTAVTAYLKGHHVISPHSHESMVKSLGLLRGSDSARSNLSLALSRCGTRPHIALSCRRSPPVGRLCRRGRLSRQRSGVPAKVCDGVQHPCNAENLSAALERRRTRKPDRNENWKVVTLSCE